MGKEEEKLKSEENSEKVVPVPAFDDQRSVYRFVNVEEPAESVFESNRQFIAYQKFAEDHNDSLGFDVEHFFPKRVDKLLTLKPVPISESKILFQACNKAVQAVLQYLDEKNEHNLVLVRIIKANYRSDFLFFVTFEARSKVSGEIKEYQSVIFHQLSHDKITLHMFGRKGDAKGVVQCDRREKYRFVSIGVAKESDFKSKDEFIAYRKYAKEHDDSEGFDIKHFPQVLGDWPMILKPLRKSNRSLFEDCKTAVQNVLEYLDTKNELNLVFVRVIKANYTSDFIFFVTFEARSNYSGEIKEYQSVIFRHCVNGKITLLMFRTKGAVKGAVQRDWRENYVFVTIGGAEESDFKSQADFNAYQIYAKEHDDSEGFDIKHFIPQLLGGLFLIKNPLRESYTSLWEDCKTAVQNVLKYLETKEECELELHKVIKANYSSQYLFFVTFEAKNKISKEIEEYQSVIYSHCVDHKICLHMFRRKGVDREEKLKSEKVVQPIDDFREEYEFLPVRQLPYSKFEKFDDFCDYEKYVKEHNDSEGFDIKTFISMDARRHGLVLFKADTFLLEHCKVAVENVLDYLNSQYEENLELVRVTKANYRADLFFVTFKAKNKVCGQINAYQSVIEYNIGGWNELLMFRKKKRAGRAKGAQKRDGG